MINKNQQYKTLIDSYFDDTMSPAAREEFIIELNENPKLKKEFDQYQEFQDAISDPDFDKVNDIISDVLRPNNKDQIEPKQQTKLYIILKYVAVALAILIFTVFLSQYFPAEDSTSKLAIKYFEPYPTYNTFRGEGNPEDLKELAFNNYDLKKYKDAEDNFEQLIKVDRTNMAYTFYKANVLMANKNYEAAIPLLKSVVESKNDLFVEQANWYLALSYLGINKIKDAKSLLLIINENKNSKYKQQTSEILSALK